MNRLYDVTLDQRRDIEELVARLLQEIKDPGGSRIEPQGLIQALRAHLRIAGPYPLPPALAADFDPQDFLYLWLPEEILNCPVEELDFTVRTYNHLKREGIDCVGELLLWSQAELMSMRNFGEGCRNEVVLKLEARGLHLSPHDADLQSPAGDEWAIVVYGLAEYKKRKVLRSQLPKVVVTALSDGDSADNAILSSLRQRFSLAKVASLLSLSRADILALDWSDHFGGAEAALLRIEAILTAYQLNLRAA